jgi:large subunit ribosomal protein L13
MKTFDIKKEEVARNWCLIDAGDKILGRVAAEIASRLRGKHKPIFSPYTDTGDFVVVINAEKIALTGKKLDDKMYHHYSGYPGGLKSISAGKLLKKKPEDVIRIAVKGMLPKNSLGRMMLKKLKIYAGNKHPHEAQQPKALEV